MNKKPTRHECGVGILGFWGMNLKSIQINYRPPATKENKTLCQKEGITKHSISPLVLIILMGGRGVLMFSFVFNKGIFVVEMGRSR